jgi:F0F1-type ATP synthase membrane subunit b/b'
VQELTTFLTEQNNKVKERLGNLEDENQNLMNENIELEKQLKNYKNQATSEINKVKRANQKLRAKSDQQNKMDLQATNTLSEEGIGKFYFFQL